MGMRLAIGLALALAADQEPGFAPNFTIAEVGTGKVFNFNLRKPPVLLHAELAYVGNIRAEEVRIGAEKIAAEMRYLTVDQSELVLGAHLLDRPLGLDAGEHLDIRANRNSVRLELHLKWR